MYKSLPLIIERYGNIYSFASTLNGHIYHCADEQNTNISITSNNTLEVNGLVDKVFNFN